MGCIPPPSSSSSLVNRAIAEPNKDDITTSRQLRFASQNWTIRLVMCAFFMGPGCGNEGNGMRYAGGCSVSGGSTDDRRRASVGSMKSDKSFSLTVNSFSGSVAEGASAPLVV